LFDGVYPFYPQQRKAAVFDISTVIVVVVFLTLACSFLLIAPGIRGRARLYWTLRVLLSLLVGVVIVVVQFTGDWETGWVQANTSYKSFSPAQVNVDIGLHIGLAGVNVTLRVLVLPAGQIHGAGHRREERGAGPCCDNGRSSSPWMELKLLSLVAQRGPWTPEELSQPCLVAFCTWIISNILFSMPVLIYGGYMLLVTGAFMIFSLLSFSTVRNSPVCPIQIGTRTLHVAYGGSFWLMLAIGLLCCVAGITVVAMHHLSLDLLKTFFDLREDKAEEYQEMPEVFINPHSMNKSL
ncbi:DOXA2 factor, partial [Rhadina sibilatrix]|nr:DOXA2 factor [Rhadina sibilatrix]